MEQSAVISYNSFCREIFLLGKSKTEEKCVNVIYVRTFVIKLNTSSKFVLKCNLFVSNYLDEWKIMKNIQFEASL